MMETYRGTVYPWQCDHMGHMNIQYYAAKFDEATWQLFNRIGLEPEYLRKHHRGMAAVDQRTTYLSELLPGDLVTVHSKIIEIGKKTLRFQHVMKKSGTNQIAAETVLTGVHINTRLRKSCAFTKKIQQNAMRFQKETAVA